MVFDWLEGKTLKAETITEKHCEIIGETVAKIHNMETFYEFLSKHLSEIFVDDIIFTKISDKGEKKNE